MQERKRSLVLSKTGISAPVIGMADGGTLTVLRDRKPFQFRQSTPALMPRPARLVAQVRLTAGLATVVALYKARQVVQGRFGTALIVLDRYSFRNALVMKSDSCAAGFFFECKGELHFTR